MSAEIIQFDWRGLKCPEPILKTALRIRELDSSTTHVRVLADDDAFPLDITRWCKSAGVELSTLTDQDDGFEAILILGERMRAPQTLATCCARADQVASNTIELLDCRGLRCPEPILQLARKVRALDDQAIIEIFADDDAFPLDIKAWSKRAKASLRSLEEHAGGGWRATVRVEREARLAPSRANTETARPRSLELDHNRDRTREEPVVLDLNRAPRDKRMARVESMCSAEWAHERVKIVSDDPKLLQEILGWVTRGGHDVLAFDSADGNLELRVAEATSSDANEAGRDALARVERAPKRATYLVIHNDFESLMAAMMVANASASQGMETTVFFSFWGVNLLRGDRPRANEPSQKLTWIHRMFRWMMPRGSRRQPLSKMHFGGVGKSMMLASMKQQNVMSLEDLIDTAIEYGVRFQVCTTSMRIMGLHKRDIVTWSNIEFSGVASFVSDASTSRASMVF